MPYFTDLNTYLHQSSLLIQAYPSTTRITTKYSLPRKPNTKSKSAASKDISASATESATDTTDATTTAHPPKREKSATLTLKTYHPQSGICLKYRTDKAAEVGRLLNGLGRLAKGEIIEVPSAATAAAAGPEGDTEKMDIDGGAGAVVKGEEKIVSATPAAMQSGASGGGKGKKKKGKK